MTEIILIVIFSLIFLVLIFANVAITVFKKLIFKINAEKQNIELLINDNEKEELFNSAVILHDSYIKRFNRLLKIFPFNVMGKIMKLKEMDYYQK